LRILQSFESGHGIASSKSFVLRRIKTGSNMLILAHAAAGFGVKESQVRCVSVRGLSASDILVHFSWFRSFTRTFFEFGPSSFSSAATCSLEGTAILPKLTGTFSTCYPYQGMNQN
jgi:hypothetical protein